MNSIPAKKSLGQNFLKSKTALNKMIEAGEVTGSDIVLEVGPGKGVLTEKLLLTAKKVIAVEKDDRLISLLQEKFASEIASNKLEIIHDDILNFQQGNYHLKTGEYKIIANIPYYITGLFLRKFLETDCQPAKIVVMVQKEIAQRIMAHDPQGRAGKKESLLSISVKAFGIPKMVMKVDKENFSPAPKVDSAILSISDISKSFFINNKIGEKEFFEILHAGFAHKRKMLISNLRALFPNIDWEGRFTLASISLKTRAEDLTLGDWSKLF